MTLKEAENNVAGLLKRVRDGEAILLVADDATDTQSGAIKSACRRAGALRDSLGVPNRLLEPMTDEELREFWGGEPL